MAYAIISLGGKQYRVSEGERLLVDRLKQEEGKTVTPVVLMAGGDGSVKLAPKDVTVTARVVRHLRGDKIVIGKHRQRTGYRRHTGFRPALTQIEIEAIGAGKAAGAPAKSAKAEKAEDAPKGLPSGYAEMTVAEVSEGARAWNRPMLDAALEYEQAHAKRKGALGALGCGDLLGLDPWTPLGAGVDHGQAGAGAETSTTDRVRIPGRGTGGTGGEDDGGPEVGVPCSGLGMLADDFDVAELRVVTKKAPTQAQMNDLVFAFRVAKFVKSNAIVFCAGGMTLGVGAGQMSRVDSTRIAAIKAKNAGLSLRGSVAASDAFFPFRDSIDRAAVSGVKYILEPGGSTRDDTVIQAANEYGMTMIFSGVRLFHH